MPDTTESALVVVIGLFIFIVIGFVGLWFRSHQQTTAILGQYKEDMAKQRRMYQNNVELVKRYNGTAKEMNDLLRLIIASLSRIEMLEGRNG